MAKLTDDQKRQAMRMASELIEKLDEPEIAIGQKIGISQQLLNKAKNYGEISEETFKRLEAAWRENGLAPPMAFEAAAGLARFCGVDEPIIEEMSRWDWGDHPDAARIFNAIIAERDRKTASRKSV